MNLVQWLAADPFDRVQWYWDECTGKLCHGCQYHDTWREPHGEQMSECDALNVATTPTDTPCNEKDNICSELSSES